jgi:hypothetical protein
MPFTIRPYRRLPLTYFTGCWSMIILRVAMKTLWLVSLGNGDAGDSDARYLADGHLE